LLLMSKLVLVLLMEVEVLKMAAAKGEADCEWTAKLDSDVSRPLLPTDSDC